MVARNALKHGIFSKNLLINDPQGGEHARDYWQLHAGISEHYQPEGLLEQLWVEKTAVWMWRLSRVVRCETGQIDRALANERSDLQKVRAKTESPETQELDSSPAAILDDLLIPSNGDLDKLLRYEQAISTQLDRALTELERLQTRRQRLGTPDGNSTKQSH